MRRKMKKLLAALLIVSMVLSLSGCSAISGLFGGKKDEPAVIYQAQIELPYSTGVRAVVEQEGAEALGAYMTARAYLMKLEEYPVDNENAFNAEEYMDLFNRAMKAFEIADQLAEDLQKNAGSLEKLQEQGYTGLKGKPSYKELDPIEVTAEGQAPGRSAGTFGDWLDDVFCLKAKAAEEEGMTALEWAKEITERYDNAPVGRGIRTLAEQLGTDAKHAYAMLKQAQAIIEGDAYGQEADAANRAYKIAVGTKAAASAIGFGLAVAATGGAAAGVAHGIAVAGATVSGCNAVLDVGSAYTTLTTNGEGTEYTEFFDNTSSDFAIVTFIVGTVGAGAGFSDAFKSETTANVINSLLFFVSQKDYVDEKSTQLFNMVLQPSDDGLDVKVQSTEKGDSPAQKEAMEQVLENAGFSGKEAEKIVEEAFPEKKEDSAKKDSKEEAIEDRDAKDEKTDDPQEADPESERSDDTPDPDEMISTYDRYTDENGNFDIDQYLENLREFLEELEELEALEDEESSEESAEESEDSEESEEPEESEEESSEESSEEQGSSENTEGSSSENPEGTSQPEGSSSEEASNETSQEPAPSEESAEASEPVPEESTTTEESSTPEETPPPEESSVPEETPPPAESSTPEAPPPEESKAESPAVDSIPIEQLFGFYYYSGTAQPTFSITNIGANTFTLNNLYAESTFTMTYDPLTNTAKSEPNDDGGIVLYIKLRFSRNSNGSIHMIYTPNLNGTDLEDTPCDQGG